MGGFLFWIGFGINSFEEECKELCLKEGTAVVMKCTGNPFTGESDMVHCVVNDTEKGVMKLVVKKYER